jgi:hypothetical protein
MAPEIGPRSTTKFLVRLLSLRRNWQIIIGMEKVGTTERNSRIRQMGLSIETDGLQMRITSRLTNVRTIERVRFAESDWRRVIGIQEPNTLG